MAGKIMVIEFIKLSGRPLGRLRLCGSWLYQRPSVANPELSLSLTAQALSTSLFTCDASGAAEGGRDTSGKEVFYHKEKRCFVSR